MNEPDNRPDKLFERRVRALYQEAGRRIDPVIAGRLRAARRHALETAQVRGKRIVRWLIPTGAFAAVALATLMVWQPLPHGAATSPNQAIGTPDTGIELDNELPPDADKTDPNLYQNLDFYGWLAADPSRPTNR
jgi:hypothetical protein